MRHYNDLSYLGADAPNVDHATGIRYGVISQHAISSYALDDITQSGTDLDYENAVQDLQDAIGASVRKAIADYARASAIDRVVDAAVDAAWTELEQDFNDGYEADGSSYLLEDEEYSVLLCADGDIFVRRSPYYTFRGLCSPCAPNAGHLQTAGDYKAYCLGPDWFDRAEGSPIPYGPVYRVDDDSIVDISEAVAVETEEDGSSTEAADGE